MNQQEMRLECLRLAVQIAGPPASESKITAVADVLFEWLLDSNHKQQHDSSLHKD